MEYKEIAEYEEKLWLDALEVKGDALKSAALGAAAGIGARLLLHGHRHFHPEHERVPGHVILAHHARREGVGEDIGDIASDVAQEAPEITSHLNPAPIATQIAGSIAGPSAAEAAAPAASSLLSDAAAGADLGTLGADVAAGGEAAAGAAGTAIGGAISGIGSTIGHIAGGLGLLLAHRHMSRDMQRRSHDPRTEQKDMAKSAMTGAATGVAAGLLLGLHRQAHPEDTRSGVEILRDPQGYWQLHGKRDAHDTITSIHSAILACNQHFQGKTAYTEAYLKAARELGLDTKHLQHMELEVKGDAMKSAAMGAIAGGLAGLLLRGMRHYHPELADKPAPYLLHYPLKQPYVRREGDSTGDTIAAGLGGYAGYRFLSPIISNLIHGAARRREGSSNSDAIAAGLGGYMGYTYLHPMVDKLLGHLGISRGLEGAKDDNDLLPLAAGGAAGYVAEPAIANALHINQSASNASGGLSDAVNSALNNVGDLGHAIADFNPAQAGANAGGNIAGTFASDVANNAGRFGNWVNQTTAPWGEWIHGLFGAERPRGRREGDMAKSAFTGAMAGLAAGMLLGHHRTRFPQDPRTDLEIMQDPGSYPGGPGAAFAHDTLHGFLYAVPVTAGTPLVNGMPDPLSPEFAPYADALAQAREGVRREGASEGALVGGLVGGGLGSLFGPPGFVVGGLAGAGMGGLLGEPRPTPVRRPPPARREGASEGALVGGLVGGGLGSIAGPPGFVTGGLMGAGLGGLFGHSNDEPLDTKSIEPTEEEIAAALARLKALE